MQANLTRISLCNLAKCPAADSEQDAMSADLPSVSTIAAAPIELACPTFHCHVMARLDGKIPVH